MKKALDMFNQDCSTALPTCVIRGSCLALDHENPVGILQGMAHETMETLHR